MPKDFSEVRACLHLGMSENTKFQVQKWGCTLYLGVFYTWVCLILGCVLYLGASYTWVRLVLGCALYLGDYGDWKFAQLERMLLGLLIFN